MNLVRWEADALCRKLVGGAAARHRGGALPLLPAAARRWSRRSPAAASGSAARISTRSRRAPTPATSRGSSSPTSAAPGRSAATASAATTTARATSSRSRRPWPRCRAGLKPLLCVGETRDERRRGETFAVLDRQLAPLAGSATPISRVWCSPTSRSGRSAPAKPPRRRSPRRPTPTCAAVWRPFGGRRARPLRILYGGSVTPDNSTGLAAMPDIDGGLVGGASFDAGKFLAIISSFAA